MLALIEAVICDRPLTQDLMNADLESHFQKLLGYGIPRVFFHLTYAYIEDKAGLMRLLEALAETASPPGFNFLGREPIPHDDSRPPGFAARYSADFGEIRVGIPRVESSSQHLRLPRQAAKTAGATKALKGTESAGTAPESTNGTDLHPKTAVPNVGIEWRVIGHWRQGNFAFGRLDPFKRPPGNNRSLARNCRSRP